MLHAHRAYETKIQYVTTIDETLRALVREEVARALGEQDSAQPDVLLSVTTVAARFDVAPATVRRALRRGLPHVGAGRLTRIKPADFEVWLNAGTPAETDVDARARAIRSRRR